jgi:EAL domain-containing protein (putative c-di-GMP-specific phosphodiesterase class I)
VGYEALVRAHDADGNAITPDRLFREAHAKGDGLLLDWICRGLHLRRFVTVDAGARRLFLNVHPETAARDARSMRELVELVRYYGMKPSALCLEIVEAPCSEPTLLREAVQGYRGLGATVVMDDFGLGGSNFDRIVSLRPDLVKIDCAILVRAVGAAKTRRMLPSIIELLHGTGAQVGVVSVESATEALEAIEAGADHLQGSHFAPPSAQLPDESLTQGILSELLRMRGSPRLSAVGGR